MQLGAVNRSEAGGNVRARVGEEGGKRPLPGVHFRVDEGVDFFLHRRGDGRGVRRINVRALGRVGDRPEIDPALGEKAQLIARSRRRDQTIDDVDQIVARCQVTRVGGAQESVIRPSARQEKRELRGALRRRERHGRRRGPGVGPELRRVEHRRRLQNGFDDELHRSGVRVSVHGDGEKPRHLGRGRRSTVRLAREGTHERVEAGGRSGGRRARCDLRHVEGGADLLGDVSQRFLVRRRNAEGIVLVVEAGDRGLERKHAVGEWDDTRAEQIGDDIEVFALRQTPDSSGRRARARPRSAGPGGAARTCGARVPGASGAGASRAAGA